MNHKQTVLLKGIIMIKMELKSPVFLFLGVCLLKSVQPGLYAGHRVVRVTSKSLESTNALEHLLYHSTDIDVWRFPSVYDQSADIRLNEDEFVRLVPDLRSAGCGVKILIDDVETLVEQQQADRLQENNVASEFDYSKYHDLKQINKWMNNKTKVYNDRCSMVNVAFSYEGRPLRALKIRTNTTKGDKPAFWIQGGIHAREWISPATILFVVGKMLDNYQLDPRLTEFVDEYEWYFLPVANPDGYFYSWTKYRLWRKSRSRRHGCIGVDLNRNWNSNWTAEPGSSSCSLTYGGPRPFSEPETKGIARFIRKKIPNAKAFLDVHSYGQLWMSPWGYSYDLTPDFYDQVHASRAAVKAMRKVHAETYYNGISTFLLAHTIHGSSIDWAYDKAGIKYSYAVELRDKGKFGFLLPENQIIPTGEEFIMLDNYQLDPRLTEFVDEYEWYFLPVANPDGYFYSWTKYRLWRKSRSRRHGCIGVDLNRNWNSNWTEAPGSSGCSLTYGGPRPFSEPETKGIARFIKKKIPNAKAFLDIHSYGQLWMSPWGYSYDLTPDFYDQVHASRAAVKAIRKVHDETYYNGISTLLLAHTIHGSSIDWAYDKAGIKYSYAVELRDKGKFGFLLPENQIIPTGEEFIVGLVTLAEYFSQN